MRFILSYISGVGNEKLGNSKSSSNIDYKSASIGTVRSS